MLKSTSLRTGGLRLAALLSAFCFFLAAMGLHAQTTPDLNGDKTSDILWRNTSTGDVSFWGMNGLNVLTGRILFSGLSLQWQILGTGKLGRNAILLRNAATGDLRAWGMDGTYIAWDHVILHGLSLDWQFAGMADFNGDHGSEILWRDSVTGHVGIMGFYNWLETSGPYRIDPPVSFDWQIVGIGDLNGDGAADVLWRNTITGDVSAWFMHYLPYSEKVIYHALPLEWAAIGMGDIDGDGKADILWRNTITGDVSVWLMDGLNIINGVVIYPNVPLEWQVVGTGDYNGDGKTDVLWYNATNGDVAVWLLNGASVTEDGVVWSGVPLEWQIALPH